MSLSMSYHLALLLLKKSISSGYLAPPASVVVGSRAKKSLSPSLAESETRMPLKQREKSSLGPVVELRGQEGQDKKRAKKAPRYRARETEPERQTGVRGGISSTGETERVASHGYSSLVRQHPQTVFYVEQGRGGGVEKNG